MAMPVDLVLVRHGESEGNAAKRRSERGDNRHRDEHFLSRSTSSWRLTDKGVEQAKAAGVWLRSAFPEGFGRYYASEYLRALETAAELDLPGATWMIDYNLRERDYGALDLLSTEERQEQFPQYMRMREIDPFFWTPPGGESVANVAYGRLGWLLDTLHRECSEAKVIAVVHGEVMWALRTRLERFTHQRYLELDRSKDPNDQIWNCQILHYTRRNPKTGEIGPYLGWFRMTRPMFPNFPSLWQPIVRRRYSNDDLRLMVGQQERRIASVND